MIIPQAYPRILKGQALYEPRRSIADRRGFLVDGQGPCFCLSELKDVLKASRYPTINVLEWFSVISWGRRTFERVWAKRKKRSCRVQIVPGYMC